MARGSAVLSSGTSNSYGQQASAPSAAQAAQSAISTFLKVAPRKYYAILGTFPKTNGGGASSTATWQQPVPIIPSFCTAIDYTFLMKLKFTINKEASSVPGSLTISTFAPYSGIQQQLTLGGAPPWPYTEMTPWYLDSILHKTNYDWQYPGLGNDSQYFATILDQGPTKNNIGTSTTNVKPGTKITNTTTSDNVTKTYTFKFRVRQPLQRKRHLLWGSVPMGDPENRPKNTVQVSPLVGTLPEQSWATLAVGATTKGVTKTGCKVYAKYELAYIDLLPPSVQSTPQPTVNFGLQLTPFSITNLAAGVKTPITHRTAQLYTAIHHILVNKQKAVRANYFGLWDDQDQQSARWSFDAQANTFTEFFDRMQAVYRRYMNTGYYPADFEAGLFPEIPSVTPYDALMTPDASYASTFGIPITPAMSTVVQLPATTTATACYARVYSFGLVRVPY